jgi:quercetin dioxygenase-like cupin family protein
MALTPYLPIFLAEGFAALEAMMTVCDERSRSGDWRALPLKVEREDEVVTPAGFCQANCARTPRSAAVLLAEPGVLACAFSAVAPGGRIAAHRHENPNVTGALCLDDGGGSFMVADGERQDYRTGEWIVFDYRALHEVVNEGPGIRLVLLVLLRNRLLDGPRQP